MRPNDTIFALSTPAGRGAVAIIRISGPGSGGAIEELAGRLPEPRRATLKALRDPVTKDLIDRAVLLWFPGPASFTGEDLAELHIHGSPAVCRRIFEVLQSQGACRVAKPGEFTRRAFENDRLDLAEAEGIADLIDADSEAQRRQALMQLSGGISDATENWKQRIAHCLAHVEALIDFADDGVPDAVIDKALQTILGIATEIKEALDDGRRGERIREGLNVAIIGPPNSGKSSLLNTLAGQDIAIVSDRPGTTRDILEVRLRLGGNIINLADTAGLRETTDSIEQEGVSRARRYSEGADLTLLILDSTRPEESAIFKKKSASNQIVVWNKCDLQSDAPEEESGSHISVRTGEGIESLLDLLTKRISSLTAGPPTIVTRTRHRTLLTEAAAALERMFHVKQSEPELIAEELRLALRAIGSLTGAVGVEDLLDLIFKDFCIGK